MKKVLFTLLLLVAVVVGCSNDNKETQQEDNLSLEIIEVTIQIPETIELNNEITIETLVTQGSDKVDDAKEVKFEIRKEGKDSPEMIEAQNDGKGIYSMKKTFTENGKYSVSAHVTARNMHSMPKKEFIVGTIDASAAEGEKEVEHDSNHESDHEESQKDDHGHHESKLTIGFNPETSFSLNTEVMLNATLSQEDAPLEGAKVRFEVIPDAGGKTNWIEATEEGKGDYSAPHTFTNKGSYHVQIHVNKDEIHDHKIFMINVK